MLTINETNDNISEFCAILKKATCDLANSFILKNRGNKEHNNASMSFSSARIDHNPYHGVSIEDLASIDSLEENIKSYLVTTNFSFSSFQMYNVTNEYYTQIFYNLTMIFFDKLLSGNASSIMRKYQIEDYVDYPFINMIKEIDESIDLSYKTNRQIFAQLLQLRYFKNHFSEVVHFIAKSCEKID